MNFPAPIIQLIHQCISTVQYQVLFNGNLSSPFLPSQGIRQGDPLSPFLFILAANVLSCSIHQLELEHKWKGIKISSNSNPISHLLYADDSLFFFEANQDSVQLVKSTLTQFCKWSGQDINHSKSNLIFSPNISNRDKLSYSELLGVKFIQRLGKYLGTWVDPGRSKRLIHNHLLETIEKRTSFWQTKLLSQASRLQLIKSVLASVGIHIMSCSLLPQHVCTQIDARCTDFFWVSTSEQKKMHLVNRNILFLPKDAGGLGLRPTSLVNKSLLSKQLWRIISSSSPNTATQPLLLSEVHAKYITWTQQDFLRSPYNASWIWKQFLQCSQQITPHLR